MPEVSENAALLIATSHQANFRIKNTDNCIKLIELTIPCDKLVSIAFLGFYLEQSIDSIIKQMGKYSVMNKFLKPKRPSLFNEFAWFYNEYIAENRGELKAKDKCQLFSKDNKIQEKLDIAFQDFINIYEFRNKIAHGKLDIVIERIKKEYPNPTDVDPLRTHAKYIVKKLITLVHSIDEKYKDIGKGSSFYDAINSYYGIKP